MARAKRARADRRRSAEDDPSREALAHLAAAMSHELRNPLHAIALQAGLLESRAEKLDGAARAALERPIALLGREVERIDRILSEYLRHVGPGEGDRAAVPVVGLIGDAFARARAAARRRGVRLVAKAAAGERWSIDPQAIGCALDRLIENAIEASPRGAAVEVRARGDGTSASLEVSDRGRGIAPEVLTRIFELGFSTRRGRRGLGLAVAKQIARGHGGSIGATSDRSGTVIRIDLPLD
jgi:signal transduction histidine kinase